MAVFRVLSHCSCAISSLCPSVGQRVAGQLHRRCIFMRICDNSGSLGSTCTYLAADLNLKSMQWKFPGMVGQRVITTKKTFCVMAAGWKEDQDPYVTLDVTRDADEGEIKFSYRKMAKQFHPDGKPCRSVLVDSVKSKEYQHGLKVYLLNPEIEQTGFSKLMRDVSWFSVYNDNTGLGDGETAETRFIRIQAAFELLMDKDQRRQYDLDHRVNPMQASKAWTDWVLKKKKAFEQRGDMAASFWAEQQQREMTLKARRLAKHKMDPEEERCILAKEKITSMKNFETTLNRHTLVLKKRELVRRKDAEEAKKKLVQQFLAAEGLELDDERY